VCVCDYTSCAGCCKDNTCYPGTANDACGYGGLTCSVCVPTATCTNQACVRGTFLSGCISPSATCSSACAALGATCLQECGPTGKSAEAVYSDASCTSLTEWYGAQFFDPCKQPFGSGGGIKCCCK
jgi:hypothetical protein